MDIIELMQEHANLVETLNKEKIREQELRRKIFDYNKLDFISLAKIISNLLTLKEGRLFDFDIKHDGHKRYDVIIHDTTPDSNISFEYGFYTVGLIIENEQNREVIFPVLYNETNAPKTVFETRYTTAYSNANFEMFPYINEFIKFLITYKVQNNRTDVLSYEEMNLLMYEFLKIPEEQKKLNSSNFEESQLTRKKN